MTLINTGCGLAGMRSLNAGSVDLVFCDLPSGETRAHFDNLVFRREVGTYNPQKTKGHKPMHKAVSATNSVNYGKHAGKAPTRGGSTERHPRSVGVAAIGLRREFVGWDFEPKPPSAVNVGLFG